MTQNNLANIENFLRACRQKYAATMLNAKLEGRKTIDRFKNGLIYYIYDGYGWPMSYNTKIRKIEEDFGSLTLPLLDHHSLGYVIKSMRNLTELSYEKHVKSIINVSNLFLLEIGLNLKKEVLASAVRSNLRDFKMLNIIHLGVVASRIATRSKKYFNHSKLDNAGKTELDYYSELLNSLVEAKIKNYRQEPVRKRINVEDLYPYIEILSILGGQEKHLRNLFKLISSNFPEKELSDDIISEANLSKINKQKIIDNFEHNAAKKIEKIIQNYDKSRFRPDEPSQELNYEVLDFHTILYSPEYEITPTSFVTSGANSYDIKRTKVSIITDIANHNRREQDFARI